MPNIKIEQISVPMGCGEGPHWDAKRKVIFFVDIPKALIFRFDPATNQTTQAKVDTPTVGFILPVEGTKDKFVIGNAKDVSVITWDGVSPTVPKSQIKKLFSADTVCWRFNDGKCDPQGRVLAGTMGQDVNGVWPPPTGALYSYGKDGKVKTIANNLGIANGLAWTKDQKTFYYIDSLKYAVDAFDYDPATGNATNRRVVFDLKQNGIEGIPDGMTIDRDENLWVALYKGNYVLNINPRTGKLLRKIDIPGRDITSVVFAGENLDELIVTSAYQDLPEEMTALIPEAGATFRVTGLGVRGYESVNAVL